MQALSVVHVALAEMTHAFDKAYNEFVDKSEADIVLPETVAKKWDDQLRKVRYREDLFLSSRERAALECVRKALVDSHMVDREPSEERRPKAAEAYNS